MEGTSGCVRIVQAVRTYAAVRRTDRAVLVSYRWLSSPDSRPTHCLYSGYIMKRFSCSYREQLKQQQGAKREKHNGYRAAPLPRHIATHLLLATMMNIVALGHCVLGQASAISLAFTSLGTRPKLVPFSISFQSKQLRQFDIFRLLATPTRNGDHDDGYSRPQEPLQSSLSDLFSIGSRISNDGGGADGDGADGDGDEPQRAALDLSRLIDDSIGGDGSIRPGVPSAFKSEFPSEGPLYEIGSGISVEDRLRQELGCNDDAINNFATSSDDDGTRGAYRYAGGVAPFLSDDEYERAAPSWDGSIQPRKDHVFGKRREGDKEAYRRITEVLLRSDGTLSAVDLAEMGYTLPPSETTKPDAEDGEELLRVLSSYGKSNTTESDAEGLHRRIFESEGILPSQLYSNGQTNRTEDASIASLTNMSAAYRIHRDEILASLDREMDELLASFPEEGTNADIGKSNEAVSMRGEAGSTPQHHVKCSCCGCQLSRIELEHAREVADSRKPLCRICDAERFVERRPYWRPPDLRPDHFAKQEATTTQQRKQVGRETRGPAHTYFEGQRNSTVRSSTVDPQKWRAKFAGQSGSRGRRILSSAPQNVNGVSTSRRTEKANVSMTKGNVKMPEQSASTRPSRAAKDFSRGEVENLREQVNSLQANVKQYELQLSRAEDEIEKLRNLVRNLEESLLAAEAVEQGHGSTGIESGGGGWVQVEDPDTGEIFYWNEETEEMKRDERF